MPAISRWLSAAIPPVTFSPNRSRPLLGRDQTAFGNHLEPRVRSKTRDPGRMAGIPPGCKAATRANGWHPSGMQDPASLRKTKPANPNRGRTAAGKSRCGVDLAPDTAKTHNHYHASV